MSENMKHAPLPWKANRAGKGSYVQTDDGVFKVVAQTYTGCDVGVAEADANARHIVRCVNAHERLVLLLQSALAELEEWMDAFPDGSCNTPPVIEDITATLAELGVEAA